LRGLAIVGVSGLALTGCDRGRPRPGEIDALQSKVLSELREFTGWLQREDVPGYIGEVNWPNDLGRNFGDTTRWNKLGELWFEEADKQDLWVTGWTAFDRGIGPHAYFCIYGVANNGAPKVLTTRFAQARVYEAHQTTPDYKRGVNLSSGYGGYDVAGFSNANPGAYGADYNYMGQESLDYLAARGVTLVRLPFRWERLQRTLSDELDEIELQRILDFVDRAASAGLEVILDVHNFGGYYLYDAVAGTGAERKIGTSYDGRVYVTQAHLANLWARLATIFQDNATVIAYDIMNEPVNLATDGDKEPQAVWEEISQNVLNVIRAQEGSGAHKLVMIPGYQTSAVRDWVAYHPRKWITDSADKYRYEAHHYFGEYDENSYSDLLIIAQAEQQRG
jgi:aryl-phospho-beta-D-glucosidase BglC (GH1 family)